MMNNFAIPYINNTKNTITEFHTHHYSAETIALQYI